MAYMFKKEPFFLGKWAVYEALTINDLWSNICLL